MKDHSGNKSRRGSKSWAGPLTYMYLCTYLDFLNRQNCVFRTSKKHFPHTIPLTALPNSEIFKICRIISYLATFNSYLLDYVPIKVIWRNIFFQFLTFYLGHFIANHPMIQEYIFLYTSQPGFWYPGKYMIIFVVGLVVENKYYPP